MDGSVPDGTLTYSAGWEKICRAVNSVYQYYSNPELLTDGMLVNISKADDILNLMKAVPSLSVECLLLLNVR